MNRLFILLLLVGLLTGLSGCVQNAEPEPVPLDYFHYFHAEYVGEFEGRSYRAVVDLEPPRMIRLADWSLGEAYPLHLSLSDDSQEVSRVTYHLDRDFRVARQDRPCGYGPPVEPCKYAAMDWGVRGQPGPLAWTFLVQDDVSATVDATGPKPVVFERGPDQVTVGHEDFAQEVLLNLSGSWRFGEGGVPDHLVWSSSGSGLTTMTRTSQEVGEPVRPIQTVVEPPRVSKWVESDYELPGIISGLDGLAVNPDAPPSDLVAALMEQYPDAAQEFASNCFSLVSMDPPRMSSATGVAGMYVLTTMRDRLTIEVQGDDGTSVRWSVDKENRSDGHVEYQADRTEYDGPTCQHMRDHAAVRIEPYKATELISKVPMLRTEGLSSTGFEVFAESPYYPYQDALGKARYHWTWKPEDAGNAFTPYHVHVSAHDGTLWRNEVHPDSVAAFDKAP